jgi:hypothetical protein
MLGSGFASYWVIAGLAGHSKRWKWLVGGDPHRGGPRRGLRDDPSTSRDPA